MRVHNEILMGLKSCRLEDINEVAITLNADKFWDVVNNQYSGDYNKMMLDKYNYKIDPKYPLIRKRGGFNLERDKIKAKKTRINQFMLDFDVHFKNKDIGKKYLIPDLDGTFVDLDGDGTIDFKVDKKGKVIDTDMSDNQGDIIRAKNLKKGNPDGYIRILGEKIYFKLDGGADAFNSKELLYYVYLGKGGALRAKIKIENKGFNSFKDAKKDLMAYISKHSLDLLEKLFDIDKKNPSGKIDDISYITYRTINCLVVQDDEMVLKMEVGFLYNQEDLEKKGYTFTGEFERYRKLTISYVSDYEDGDYEDAFKLLMKACGIKKEATRDSLTLSILGEKITFKLVGEARGGVAFNVYRGGVYTDYQMILDGELSEYNEINDSFEDEIITTTMEEIYTFYRKVFGKELKQSYHVGYNGIKGYVNRDRESLVKKGNNYEIAYKLWFNVGEKGLELLKDKAGSMASTSFTIDKHEDVTIEAMDEYFKGIVEARGLGDIIINDTFKRIAKVTGKSETSVKRKMNISIPITRKMRALINKEKTFTCIYEDDTFKKAFERADREFGVRGNSKLRAFSDFNVAKAYSGTLSKYLAKDKAEILCAKLSLIELKRKKSKFSIVFDVRDEAGIKFNEFFGTLEIDGFYESLEDGDIDELLRDRILSMNIIATGQVGDIVLNDINDEARGYFLEGLNEMLGQYKGISLVDISEFSENSSALAHCTVTNMSNESRGQEGKAISNIRFNTKFYSDSSYSREVDKSYSDYHGYFFTVSQYYDKISDSLACIARHEFGHAVHTALLGNVKGSDRDDNPIVRALLNYEKAVYNIDKEDMKINLSYYSISELTVRKGSFPYLDTKTNQTDYLCRIGVECFAECFALLGTKYEDRIPSYIYNEVKELAELAKGLQMNKYNFAD